MTTVQSEAGSVRLTGDQRDIFEEIDRYARQELHPLQERMDNEEAWPDEIFPKLGEQGWLGVTAPAELGGAGLDGFVTGLVAQAMGRWNPAVGLSYLAHENLCVNNLLLNGSPELKERFVPGLCSGELVGALALTEPEAGSDALGGMRTTARQDGDHYVLDGTKLFITNGPIADVVLVYAKTTPDRGPHGISAFLVERGTQGFSVAQKLVKMGLRGSPTGELVFDGCRVPAANMVGERDRGVAVVMGGLDLERIVLAFLVLGMTERALDLAVSYARDRRQFGRPISEFGMLRGAVADTYAELETLRSFTYDVGAQAAALGHRDERRALHSRAAALALQASLTCSRACDRAVQIHGGSGFMWETEVNRLYRAAKLFEIGAGTNEVRRSIIADALLGRSAG